jgi:hypothetical protein
MLLMMMVVMQREGLGETEELAFDFHRQRFVYSVQENCFKKLDYPTKVGEWMSWSPAGENSRLITHGHGEDPHAGLTPRNELCASASVVNVRAAVRAG